MAREYYSDSISSFLAAPPDLILGKLARGDGFPVEQAQRDAWLAEIKILQDILRPFLGAIYFEYSIPRMGRRIDTVLLIGPVIFVLEFKVGEDRFPGQAIDQAWDYALDLSNFHETSHSRVIAPILISTEAPESRRIDFDSTHKDKVLQPICTNAVRLGEVISQVLEFSKGDGIDRIKWESGRYFPTPTIVEAAMALYSGHSVDEISRSDAGAINWAETSDYISKIIAAAQKGSRKAICFVTGVPGAGKTLVGLNIATKHIDKDAALYSVFLSGNGPLVDILREALTRDKVRKENGRGNKVRKGEVMSEVKMFIQNVHHFRDDCLEDANSPPLEHVALFDEAQRAWDLPQTSNFMRRKKGMAEFNQSEPDFLISCLDRHPDWAVVVCLVGGGQEIHSGEAGIAEWVETLERSYKGWDIYISSRLSDSEYGAGKVLASLKKRKNIHYEDSLHLGVSMRSFRAEHVSLLVKQLLDLEGELARETFSKVREKYPIVLTRDVAKAKVWLKARARGGRSAMAWWHPPRHKGLSRTQSMLNLPWILSIGSSIAKRIFGHPITLRTLPRSFIFKGWSWTGPVSLGMGIFDMRNPAGSTGHSVETDGRILRKTGGRFTSRMPTEYY